MQILFDAFEQILANRKNILIIDATQNIDLIADQAVDALIYLN